MTLNRGNQKYYSCLGPNGLVNGVGAYRYVWKSNALDGVSDGLTTSDLTAIGVSEFDINSPGTGYIFEANSPKPPKFTKAGATNAQITTSTFGGVWTGAAKQTAEQAGWKKTKKHRVKSSRFLPSNRQRPVFVVTNGVNYAYNMHIDLYNALQPDFTNLGIDDCDEDTPGEYVWGCTYPKPARVAKVVTIPANATATPPVLASSDTFSCFISDTALNNLPQNYRIISSRQTFTI